MTDTEHEIEMLKAIAEYESWGWIMQPLSRPDNGKESAGKAPLIEGWQHFTKTPENLDEYIANGFNLGLVTGKGSGTDAFDFDSDIFIDELFAGVEFKTLTSSHRAGKGHSFIEHADDMVSEKHHFIGIEYFGNNAQGAGGNIVLPPSIHVSGEKYKWNNPGTKRAILPDRVKENWRSLAKREDMLHDYFRKCRHCFTKGSKKYTKEDPRSKGLWDRPDSIAVHGTDGRAAVIAIMGELKGYGCPDDLLHMACKRFFGKSYDFKETDGELKHIKPIHPKCSTLRKQLNVECDGCKWTGFGSDDIQEVKDNKICGTCFFCPKGGIGGCRNPGNDEGKKKRRVVDTDKACQKYRGKANEGSREAALSAYQPKDPSKTDSQLNGAREIFFTQVPGMHFWKTLDDNKPPVFKTVKHFDDDRPDIYSTFDRQWFIKCQGEGLIEAVQPENKFGITRMTIIEGALHNDPITYRLDLVHGDGSGGTIDIEESRIFSFSYFRQKYAAHFQRIIERMSTEAWEAILDPLIDAADRVHDDTNESPVVVDIINTIEDSQVVLNKKELTEGGGDRIWLEKETDTLWVLSHNIEPIADKYDIELKRLSDLAADLKKGKAVQKRIAGRQFSLWPFRPERFKLTMMEQSTESKDKERPL